jgi:hypothetical protein
MSNQKQCGANYCCKSYCFFGNDCSDNENDTEIDSIDIYDKYSHSEIMDRCDFGQNHLIHARLSSNKPIIQEQVENNIENNFSNSVPTNGAHSAQKTNITYPTMLKLICRALIGG